ncbi:MAG: aldo/keto reductase [Bryobacteraceae bacterium]|nr:aldo/keto reductase [Bryobacteraceae bacterium]
MRYQELGRTGLKLSEIGFGASPLGDEFGSVDEQEGIRAVEKALDLGINFFDVAPYYGRGLAEIRLGAALRGRREEAIVATKCARFDVDRFDFSARSARESIDASLQRLHMDYVDILHVHDVEFGEKRQIVEETLPALREIQQSGKARFIGITGLALKMLLEIATEFRVDCILSYCRYNLLNQDLSIALAPFAKQNGIGLINASPLHMGLLSDGGAPEWNPAPAAVKIAAKQVVALCRRRNVNPSSFAIRFASQYPDVASTLAGMATVDYVCSNLLALEQLPDPELMAEVRDIVRPVQHLMWVTGRPENH